MVVPILYLRATLLERLKVGVAIRALHKAVVGMKACLSLLVKQLAARIRLAALSAPVSVRLIPTAYLTVTGNLGEPIPLWEPVKAGLQARVRIGAMERLIMSPSATPIQWELPRVRAQAIPLPRQAELLTL